VRVAAGLTLLTEPTCQSPWLLSAGPYMYMCMHMSCVACVCCPLD
jgi:hypothetical protein